MGDVRGFLKFKREESCHRPVDERKQDYDDVCILRSEKTSKDQASRCMDCGTPFCHSECPVANYIPEWNDLAYTGEWKKAYELLDATNGLPEITGRLCPVLCEYACVLGINDDPVTIRENELAIIENAFKKGYVKPAKPLKRTGKKVAVIGSGPAGLALADQLNRAGHTVTVFEKDKKAGGIMRYGIPDFKLEKEILDRRINILKEAGVVFRTGVEAGKDFSVERIKKEFDAVALTGGSRVPRDLKIEGRNLNGIYFALDYLIQQNKRVAKEGFEGEPINAKGKTVIVIGGGDTGSDCVGTANRQGAKKVVQIELLPTPPKTRPKSCSWPKYPLLFKTTSSHEEGVIREWAILTKKFIGQNETVKKLSCVRVEFVTEKGCDIMKEIPGTEFEIETDLVILAMGFVHPEKGLINQLGIELDQRENVKTGLDYMTSVKNIFAAGDIRRGQSLIVWAISEGRRAAYFIDKYLMGISYLPLI